MRATPATPSQNGFTLVEMLIVVAVISVMSLLIVFQFAGSSDFIELDNAQAVVVADLNTAQTWANAGKRDDTGNAPRGYGVVVFSGSTEYFIYANNDDDYRYSAAGGQDRVVKTVDLKQTEGLAEVRITNCTPVETIDAQAQCDVYFDSADATIFTNGTATEHLSLTLEHTVQGDTATVSVNRLSGVIESVE